MSNLTLDQVRKEFEFYFATKEVKKLKSRIAVIESALVKLYEYSEPPEWGIVRAIVKDVLPPLEIILLHKKE